MKKKIQEKCKTRGYTINLEVTNVILSFVTRFEPTELDEAVDLVLESLDQESIKSRVIGLEQVQRVVNLLLEADAEPETCEAFVSSSSYTIVVIHVFYVPI